MPVGREKIEISVVVVVEKLHAYAREQYRDRADTTGDGRIIERSVAVVVVERVSERRVRMIKAANALSR